MIKVGTPMVPDLDSPYKERLADNGLDALDIRHKGQRKVRSGVEVEHTTRIGSEDTRGQN